MALQTGNIKDIRIAALIALTGNAILAIVKIATGMIAGSGALIADGVDSSADVFISVVTLFVVRIMTKPADARHPWGHRRAETVTTAFLAFVLFFMGAQLIINSVTNFTSDELNTVPSIISVVVTIISIVGKVLLALSQFILGKRANSSMIKANAKNMASDVLVSLSVLAALIISRLTGSSYADAIVQLLIGAWIIKTAIGIFLEANLELMDGNIDIEPYRVITASVNAVEGAANPHRARIRNIAGFWDIVFDITVDPKCSVNEAHAIASHVENEIKQRMDNVFDIVIHVEPLGDDAMEGYGLTEAAMNGESID